MSLTSFLKKKPRVVRYRLERLAEIWQNPESLPTNTRQEEDTLDQLEWTHDECTVFWRNYVLSYRKAIQSSGLFPTIQSLLTILDESGDFSSIDPDDPETPDQYKALKGVSLRTHSIQVAQRAVDFMGRDYNDFQMIAGKAIIAALAHDIGKMNKEVPNAAHSVSGAKWCEYKLSGVNGTEIIIEAVRCHHAEKRARPTDNPILVSLMRADEEVRNDELRRLENQRRRKQNQAEKTAEPEATPPPVAASPAAENPVLKTESDRGPKAPAQPLPEQPDTTPDETSAPRAVPETPFDDVPAQSTSTPATGETPNPPPVQETQEEKPEPSQSEQRSDMQSSPREKWLTEEALLQHLSGKISQTGFEAFIFEGRAYFQPKILKASMKEMAEANGDTDFIKIMENYIEPLVAGIGFANNKTRLRFAGKKPPQKNFYFIIDTERLDLPEDFEEIPPRDLNGRFLKKITILEK